MKRMLNEASAFREEMIAGTPAPTGGTFSASLARRGDGQRHARPWTRLGRRRRRLGALSGVLRTGRTRSCLRRRDRGYLHVTLRRAVLSRGEGGRRRRRHSLHLRQLQRRRHELRHGRRQASRRRRRCAHRAGHGRRALRKPEEADRRRGIAGGFFVFKSAGASAARGDSLDDVEALARHANSRVRTAGIAFAGCTVPGQDQPLFSVAPGQMEIGLGIHGEPGCASPSRCPRDRLPRCSSKRCSPRRPGTGSDVAVLVNGLGGTKYEEMFVFYNDVAALLDRSGLSPQPLIGEFVTSLDMTGMSLSLLWLDDDLKHSTRRRLRRRSRASVPMTQTPAPPRVLQQQG